MTTPARVTSFSRNSCPRKRLTLARFTAPNGRPTRDLHRHGARRQGERTHARKSRGETTRDSRRRVQDRRRWRAVSVSSRVTVKWKLQTKVEEFTEDTFTMQDGTHPTGLENAILGLCAGDRVNFVLFGEASLNDFEPPPKDARGEVALSGEAEVLRVSHVRKCVYTSTPEEKAAYATEMNDIGKVLFKNARLDRARENLKLG